MLNQLKQSKEENQKNKSLISDLQNSLKKLYAILRSPKLVDLFHKAERKKSSKEQIQKANQEAYLNLNKEFKLNESSAD